MPEPVMTKWFTEILIAVAALLAGLVGWFDKRIRRNEQMIAANNTDAKVIAEKLDHVGETVKRVEEKLDDHMRDEKEAVWDKVMPVISKLERKLDDV